MIGAMTHSGRCSEEQRKKDEEISLNLQRLARAVVHMSKKEKDKFQQRILEAQSQENIIRELNNIDQRLKKQQRQGHEHIQQLPSAQSPNQTRTSCVMSQSALPHHPTVPPESDHKYAGDPEKGNWSHRSGQGGQQGQQYQQEQQEPYDQKQKQEQQDLPHQGQHYKQLIQRQNDQRRNEGPKEQLNQRQKCQLNQGKQVQEQEAERDQPLRQAQYKSRQVTPGQKYQQENQEQQGQQYQQQGQGSKKQKQGQRDQQPKQCWQEKVQHQGQQDQQKQQGLKDLERQGQKDQQLNHGQQDQQQQQDQQSKRGQKDQNRKQGYVPVSYDAIYKGLFGFLIWLLLLLPVASSQCSTCLGGKCYDTGQCILGCVPGYMNQYCDKACPSNCLNNACELNTTSATITCTDGCRPGYCGTKCTRPCPEGCVTCDRQCGSCNKTICPERHYGEGCRSVCSLKYEKCDKETGQCIICRQGYYGDNCNRTCDTCCSRGQNLMYKCLSGCEICKEEDSCPEGLFGGNCELKCSEKCGRSQETARHPCNRATGECAAGCMSGYYGLTCNHACSEHCLSGRCNRATGECSDGCVSGYYGLTCTFTCDGFCKGELCNQHDGVCTYGCVSGFTQKSKACEKLHDTGVKDVTISFTVLIILISCIVVSVLFLVIVCIIITRRFITRIKSDRLEYADRKAMECLIREDFIINHSDLQRQPLKSRRSM